MFERVPATFVVSSCSQRAQPLTLTLSHARIDGQDLGCWLRLAALKAIRADNNALATLHLALIFIGCILNFRLDIAGFDGCQRTATLVDALDVLTRAVLDLIGS